MGEEAELGPKIIDAHQELVRHIEQTAGKIRALSIITVVVAAVLSASYAYQLLLPLTGTVTVTVNLSAPSNVGAEVVVLFLVLAWLYVGVRDLKFSSRMAREIRTAREKEKEIVEKLS